ncbi:hypothetical protein Tco_0038998 [Tanacetum coccineum]
MDLFTAAPSSPTNNEYITAPFRLPSYCPTMMTSAMSTLRSSPFRLPSCCQTMMTSSMSTLQSSPALSMSMSTVVVQHSTSLIHCHCTCRTSTDAIDSGPGSSFSEPASPEYDSGLGRARLTSVLSYVISSKGSEGYYTSSCLHGLILAYCWARIRRIFLDGYGILVVRTIFFRFLRLSSRMLLFDVDTGRISIVTVNTKEYHSDVLARSQG